MARFYAQLVAALVENQPFALALISGVKGSSPQRIGAKALFFPDGRIVGTLGGGCLEAEVHARARKALQSGQPATFEMRLDHNFGWDDGLICGGSVSGLILPQARQSAELWRKLAAVTEPFYWGVKKDFSIAPVASGPGEWLYQEIVSPPNALWIAGSGHVARAVAPLALQLDFDVTILTTGRNWPITSIFRRTPGCAWAPGTNFCRSQCPSRPLSVSSSRADIGMMRWCSPSGSIGRSFFWA